MSKTITIIELLNRIAKGEIKDGQRFIVTFKNQLTREIFYRGWKGEEKNIASLRNYSDNYPFQDEYDLDDKVEILEDEETIDINDIEELYIGECTTEERLKINEIIRYLKQINKLEER